MNLGEWWQENKRFAVTVASGAIVFVIGMKLVDTFFTQELNASRASLNSAQRKLASEALYSSEQLAQLQRENEALVAATDELRKVVNHQPRPAFAFDATKGAAANQYFQTVATVREELLTLAGRANLRLPEELGLPALSPTREPDIARYLAGLDVVDRAVRMALAAGVERIDKLEIKLDPKLNSKDGPGAIEHTRISLTCSGKAAPIVQFLLLTQDPASGGPLIVERSEMQPPRGKADEAVLEIVFDAVRLQEKEPESSP